MWFQCLFCNHSWKVRLDTRAAHVHEVLRNFVPVFFSRGAVQISGYVDQDISNGGYGLLNALTIP